MAAKTTVKVSLTNNAAKDDSFSEANYSWLNENGSLKGDLNVLANDPGSAKLLGVSDVLPTTQSELTNGSDTVKAMFNNVVYDIKITANADGTVNFDASSLQAALQSLHGDEVFSTSFYYTVQMANGTYSTAKVDIVIGGEDDAATFSGDTTGAVVEDTTTSVSGDLNVSDLDHDQSGFQAASAADLAGDYGNFTFNEATGAWSYMLDHDLADSLYAGQIVYETLTVKSTDGTTQDIVVKVTGTNDDPVLTVDDTGSVTEDAGDTLTDSGTLSFNDVDNGDTHTFSAALDSVSGDITISAALQTALESAMSADNNSWDFSLDNSLVQGLGAGEKITVTYKVTVADNHGGSDTETVTVTINGTNDQPTLTLVSNNGSVAEDTSNPNLTVSGALSSTDADLNDTHSFSASFASAVGNNGASVSAGLLTALQSAMSADSNSWDFSVANSLVQYLNSGQSVTVTYNVTATDDSGTGTASDTKMVTITLNGVDEPVVNVADPNDHDDQTGSGTATNGNDNPLVGTSGNNGTVSVPFSGLQGDDVIYGLAGDDVIAGNNGNDTIYGGSGNDNIQGNNDADVLYGGSGNDIISGNGGNDTIVGGHGQDSLTGNNDADVFKFLSVQDSSSLALADTINGFVHGTDKIDLSAIDAKTPLPAGDDAFLYGGNNVNAVANSVTWYESGGNTILQADTNGDTTADLVIVLSNTGLGLTASDFVL